MDQREIELQLEVGTETSFGNARAIYENGAYSRSVAVLTLEQPLLVPITEGRVVVGTTGKMTGPNQKTPEQVQGTVLNDYAAGERVIKVLYQVSSNQETYSNCQVGANPNPNTAGCTLVFVIVVVAVVL